VPNPYAAVLRTPGALAFSGAGLLARLPIAMIGIAVVLLVGGETGSYGLAGAVAAVAAVAEAVIAPQGARLVDRYGQRRIVIPQLAVHVGGMVLLVVAVRAGAPRWTYIGAAILTGFLPNMGAFVRARWRYALPDGPLLRTAFSLESVLDEVVFVIGPPLVTAVAATWGPSAAILVLVVGIGVVGAALLLVQGATEPPASGSEGARHGSALRSRGLVELLVVLVFLGGIFGAVEVATVAWADEAGHPARAGVVLACYAFGSLVAGLTYGVVHPALSLHRQLLVGCWTMSFCVVGFAIAQEPWALCLVALVAGLSIAPTLVASFSLVEQLVHGEQLTEGLSWLSTGIVLGIAISAPIAGRVVDATSPHRAYVVPVVFGFLAAISVTLLQARLAPRPAWPDPSALGDA
jgi:hypothetical protein